MFFLLSKSWTKAAVGFFFVKIERRNDGCGAPIGVFLGLGSIQFFQENKMTSLRMGG